MAKERTDELLRALAELGEEGADRVAIDADTLAAYRRGELSGEERTSIELALADDPDARAALAAGARVAAGPSERVRASVLREATATGRRATSPWALAAAAVFVGALFAAQLLMRPDRPLPAYESSIDLPGTTRSSVPFRFPGAARVRAAGDEPIRIAFRPAFDAAPDIEMGLYRREGDAVVRVDGEPWVTADSEAGSGYFLVPEARDLVGPTPGTTAVWLVEGRRGDLPRRLPLVPGADDEEVAASLAEGGRRLPTAFRVEIVPAAG